MDGLIDSDVDARGFSVRMGYYLARASESAYEEHSDWIDEFGPGNRITFFTCGQFRGLVGLLEKVAVLAFRGTQNIGNFLTDADTLFVSQSPYPGRVHCGFAQAVEDVWPEVRRILGSPSRARPLWVTGHSLGGAMATLASVRLTSEGYKVRAVYTYGSPRVGDRIFRDSYRLANYRFVNDNDLVPHLPFRWCYKHVGKLRLLDNEGDFTEEQAAWVAKKRVLAGKAKRVHRAHRDSAGVLHVFSEFDWLADHYINKYLSAIRKLLPQIKPNASGAVCAAICATFAISVGWTWPRQRFRGCSERRRRRKLVISEADFIAAFGNQAPRRQTDSSLPASIAKQLAAGRTHNSPLKPCPASPPSRLRRGRFPFAEKNPLNRA